MTASGAAGPKSRCPVCGKGTLADIDFGGEDQFQDPESRQVDTYTCGHEVPRAPLEVADTDRLDVEQRTSEEATAPNPIEEANDDAGRLKDPENGGPPARPEPAAPRRPRVMGTARARD
jgi:hypothetical protein